MSKITRVLAVPAVGAYYCTDLTALQETPRPIAEQYTAEPATPSFRRVREVAEAVSVGLVLTGSDEPSSEPERPAVAWGDCVAVAHSGKAGRDPVFRTVDGIGTIRQKVAPVLEGREVTSFRELAAEIELLTSTQNVLVPKEAASSESDVTKREGLSRRELLTAPLRYLRPEPSDGEVSRPRKTKATKTIAVERRLHTAIRYGISQALLKAVAHSRGLTMAEVIAEEWDLPQPGRPVPIHAQSGYDWEKNADKMIVRQVDSLPNGLVEDIPGQLGEDGEKLVRYVRWLKDRIQELGPPDYRPAIHVDLHGALGSVYDNNLGRMLGYLYRLESSVQPYTLRIESPLIMESRAEQIEMLATLREYVRFRQMAVQIVADEWANTLEDIRAFVKAKAADMIQIKMPDLGGIQNAVEAVLTCKRNGVGAFLGGSCTETDLSSRVSVHVALATRPDIMMAKPGMGVDEALSMAQNEMTRTLVQIKACRE